MFESHELILSLSLNKQNELSTLVFFELFILLKTFNKHFFLVKFSCFKVFSPNETINSFPNSINLLGSSFEDNLIDPK